MQYQEPETVAEAVRLLASDPEARCLAGGQTLVAMMNAGLLRPPLLVGLRRIRGLDEIHYEPDGTLMVGAMATHKSVARSTILRGGHRLLGDAARRIAHPAIRTRGTLGGSICHADAAADYPAVVVALGADVEIAGAGGPRRLQARDFFQGFLTTALEAGEMVTALRFPPTPDDAVAVYEKHARCDGDFAIVSVALTLSLTSAAPFVAVALGSCGPVPIRSATAERLLLEGRCDDASVSAAVRLLADEAAPTDDLRGSAAYRRLLILRLTRRAIGRALRTSGLIA
jgi:carbon-monoxide dehydrogenase medium subunit